MAKTLVGLYDTFAEAEQVVQDLVRHGFARSDMQLVTERAAHAAGRAADQASAWEDRVMSGGTAMVDVLTDAGVPSDEAAAYAEGVRRGGPWWSSRERARMPHRLRWGGMAVGVRRGPCAPYAWGFQRGS
jgi:hypothetical protein